MISTKYYGWKYLYSLLDLAKSYKGYNNLDSALKDCIADKMSCSAGVKLSLKTVWSSFVRADLANRDPTTPQTVSASGSEPSVKYSRMCF